MSDSNQQTSRLSDSQAYDLWSSSYDTLDNPMLAMIDLAIDVEPFSANKKRVAELGCGTGRNIARIESLHCVSYTGIDASPGMLARAREKSTKATLIKADLQKQLPIEDGSLDFVFATLVFEHIQSLLPPLKEAFRILAIGGKLRILEIHSDLSSQGTKAHFNHGDGEIALSSYPHTIDEWRAALSNAGFELSSVKSLFADDEAIRRCGKLAKHRNKAVLIDIKASKPV